MQMAQAVGVLLVATALAILPIATCASPPDPTWIEGIYDLADGDDIVTFIRDTAASKHRASFPVALVIPLTYNLVSPPHSSEALTTRFEGRYKSSRPSENTRGPPQPSRLYVRKVRSTASRLICLVIPTPPPAFCTSALLQQSRTLVV
jgi:hypothetical protein